jgi:mRNA interferase MazF
MEGKIILVKFPQDKEAKTRPALVLRSFPKYGDLLLCGISSQMYEYMENFDILINESHLDFVKSGLKHAGICRLNFLTMVSETEIIGAMGEVSSDTRHRLLKNLSDYLVN